MADKINGWGNLYRELLSCKFSTWNEIIQIYDFNSGCFYNKCVTILNERKCDLFYVFSVFMVRPSYCHKRRHYFLFSPCGAVQGPSWTWERCWCWWLSVWRSWRWSATDSIPLSQSPPGNWLDQVVFITGANPPLLFSAIHFKPFYYNKLINALSYIEKLPQNSFET